MDFKFTKDNIIDSQDFFPYISYRFWDIKDAKMYEVKEITYNYAQRPVFVSVFENRKKDTNTLKSINDGYLLPSTNIYSKNKEEIYLGDLVVCNFLPSTYKIRVVYWDNGARVFGASTDEFEDNAGDLVYRICSRFENPKLYNNYLKAITSKLEK